MYERVRTRVKTVIGVTEDFPIDIRLYWGQC